MLIYLLYFSEISLAKSTGGHGGSGHHSGGSHGFGPKGSNSNGSNGGGGVKSGCAGQSILFSSVLILFFDVITAVFVNC